MATAYWPLTSQQTSWTWKQWKMNTRTKQIYKKEKTIYHSSDRLTGAISFFLDFISERYFVDKITRLVNDVFKIFLELTF